MHNLYEWATCEYHKEESARCGRPLHARVTVNEHGVTGSIFAEQFVSYFGSPRLHIIDFLRLEIIVYGNAILVRNRRVKRHLFCTIEDGDYAVLLEPSWVQSRIQASYPYTGYDFVGIRGRFHTTLLQGTFIPASAKVKYRRPKLSTVKS